MPSSNRRDELGRFILPLMTIAADGDPICAGSCVVITTAKKHAVALTAKHVIDFVELINGRDDAAELRVAPHFRKKRYDEVFRPMPIECHPNFDHETFVLIPTEQSIARLQKISHFPGGELDIVAIGLEIGIGLAPRFPLQCRIMSNGPAVGDPVVLCGFPNGNTASFEREAGRIEFNYLLQTLTGHVIERFDWGRTIL